MYFTTSNVKRIQSQFVSHVHDKSTSLTPVPTFSREIHAICTRWRAVQEPILRKVPFNHRRKSYFRTNKMFRFLIFVKNHRFSRAYVFFAAIFSHQDSPSAVVLCFHNGFSLFQTYIIPNPPKRRSRIAFLTNQYICLPFGATNQNP